MIRFLQAFFHNEPKRIDPKAERWAKLFQTRARLTGQLPEAQFMKDSGLGPDHRFWKEDNQNPSKGFAVNFDIPLIPFLDGTEDEIAPDQLKGFDDFGREVSTIPIKPTGKTLQYEFMDRILDLPIQTDSVTTRVMVDVCCGLLALRILPRRNDFSIASNLDFRKARLYRVAWDPNMQAWHPYFSFDPLGNLEQGSK